MKVRFRSAFTIPLDFSKLDDNLIIEKTILSPKLQALSLYLSSLGMKNECWEIDEIPSDIDSKSLTNTKVVINSVKSFYNPSPIMFGLNFGGRQNPVPTPFEWSSNLDIGNAELNEQHKKLFTLINTLDAKRTCEGIVRLCCFALQA